MTFGLEPLRLAGTPSISSLMPIRSRWKATIAIPFIQRNWTGAAPARRDRRGIALRPREEKGGQP